MGAAQTNIVQKQTRYSNDEQNGQFAQLRTSKRTTAKSRRLAAPTVSNGTESSKAICVRQINSEDVRPLAASAENGS